MSDSIALISDEPERKAISDSWFEQLCSDKMIGGRLKPEVIKEYSDLRKKPLEAILPERERTIINPDIKRALLIKRDKTIVQLDFSNLHYVRMHYIISILTNKLTEKYGEFGKYLQTFTTMCWPLYSYMGNNEEIGSVEISGKKTPITDKEVKTFLLLFKIICDIEEKLGLFGSPKRTKKNEKLIRCIINGYLKNEKFKHGSDSMFDKNSIEQIFYLLDEGSFAFFAYTSNKIDKEIDSKSRYFLEKLTSKSIVNNKFDPIIAKQYLYFILRHKLKPAEDIEPTLEENIYENRYFISNSMLESEFIDEFTGKTLKSFEKICSTEKIADYTNNKELCICRQQSGAGKRKRKKTRKKRKRRIKRRKCSKKRLKKKMICHRGTKKRLKKLEKYTKKLKLRLTKCSKKRLSRWKN